MGSGVGRRANRRRGEIEAVVSGERRILCLTLGSLAELETAFAADNLADLGTRFSAGGLKARDMIVILGAGLRGGGNLMSDEDVAEISVEGGIVELARLTGELLAVTFGAAADAGDAPPGP